MSFNNDSNLTALAKLGKQVRRGSWTDDPADPNYRHHWNGIEAAPGETIESAFAATLRPRGGLVSPKNMATVRITDQAVYVDTPSVERIGPLASLAGSVLDRSGANTPRRIPLDQVRMAQGPSPGQLTIETPGLTLTARTAQPLRRPAELSPGDQLRRLRDLFRN